MANVFAPVVPALTLTAARVWDGSATSVLHDGFVRVEAGRITAVGRRADLGPGNGAPVRDLGDVTLLPGLVNCHTHLTFNASPTTIADHLAERAAGPATLALRAAQNLLASVEVGVTTIRDCGTLNEVAFAARTAVADGVLPGPRVVASGHGITITGGHCHFFSHEADTADEVRRAVRLQAKAGADLIKVFASGGNLTPGSSAYVPQYTEEELRACTDEAARWGKPVSAHAHAPASVRRSVAAGVSTIEHCSFDGGTEVGYDQAVVDEMAAAGIVVVPTVGASTKRTLGDAGYVAANPAAARLARLIGVIRANVARMAASGVTVVSGSDAGIPNRPFADFPADVGAMADPPEEFGAGLGNLAALVGATSGAARAIGLTDTGVLAPGMRADLLAVAGDPLARIADLCDTRFVMAAGRVVVGAR